MFLFHYQHPIYIVFKEFMSNFYFRFLITLSLVKLTFFHLKELFFSYKPYLFHRFSHSLSFPFNFQNLLKSNKFNKIQKRKKNNFQMNQILVCSNNGIFFCIFCCCVFYNSNQSSLFTFHYASV